MRVLEVHLLGIADGVKSHGITAGVADYPASAFDIVGGVMVVAVDPDLRLREQVKQIGDKRTGEGIALKPGMHRPLGWGVVRDDDGVTLEPLGQLTAEPSAIRLVAGQGGMHIKRSRRESDQPMIVQTSFGGRTEVLLDKASA